MAASHGGDRVSSRSTSSSLDEPRGVEAEASSSLDDPRGVEAEASSALDEPRGVEAEASSSLDEPRGGGVASVRRGLPRTRGGEPWPPAGTVPSLVTSGSDTPDVGPISPGTPTPHLSAPEAAGTAADVSSNTVSTVSTVATVADVSTPLPWRKTVWDGRAPRHVADAPASSRRLPTWPQAIAGLFGAAALGILAGAAVAFVRALLSVPFMQDFLAAFPGEYEPAVHVEPGFAPWIGWQHFFNVFLMVLIIRSGLRIRSEKRPTAFWTPRNNPKGKVSLTIWFHQALDILWLVNGVIFVVLLFVTGHWARIVPTSWEVFPNALSAALQYVSFDWPHENGWNNYNSLQQIAYFATVFLAAPLAAVTGFRMSGMWPKRAERLSKAYPIEWARAVHFPVMLYFVAFIVVHVALVFLTGFLRNLNHMYAAQDAVTWTGFWVFVASMVVIGIGWVAARPLVIAPIAKLFGNVSGR
ncbi:cytochrome b/b6 domain-containing protein [Microbacterium sp. LWO14-1.2]|uniref:cytochrome b/b6 domain-containing protein n=1 Tax=Microbacterium sp. LWO14-1.2 TaxID=3135263 RepID=UPI0031387F60